MTAIILLFLAGTNSKTKFVGLMSENLQYEDEMNRRFDDDDLPMPDMDQSWQKMKQKLDEDKKRPFPPFLLNGCLVGVLLIGIVGLVWFFYKGPDNGKQTTNNVTGINKEQTLPNGSEARKNQQAKVEEKNAGMVTPTEAEHTIGKATELPNKETDKNQLLTRQKSIVKSPAHKAKGSIVSTSRQKEIAPIVKQAATAKKRSVTNAENNNTVKTTTGVTNKGGTTPKQLKDTFAANKPSRGNASLAERIDTNRTNTQVPNKSDSLLANNTTQQPVKDTSLPKGGATSPNKAKDAKTNEKKIFVLRCWNCYAAADTAKGPESCSL